MKDICNEKLLKYVLKKKRNIYCRMKFVLILFENIKHLALIHEQISHNNILLC